MRVGSAFSSAMTRISLGPRQHIDPHLAENHPLGQGDVDVAGADDLIDPGMVSVPQARAAIAWAPPYFEDPIHPREASRDKDCRMDFALPANGGGHDDLPPPLQP